jgi:DNA-binding GntR family transcriptional regulator
MLLRQESHLLPRTLRISRSLADQAAERIRRHIVKGDYQLGEALSETTLAAELGVSKTPIREALLRLKTEGLVDIQPQRGTFVFSMGTAEVRALSEFRDVLESAALSMAMRKDAAALGADLAKIVADMEHALEQDDAGAYREHDSSFHDCIIRCCSNPYLADAYAPIAFRVQTLRNLLSRDPALNARSLTEHMVISRAVASGDEEKAVKLLRAHMDGTAAAYEAWGASGEGARFPRRASRGRSAAESC